MKGIQSLTVAERLDARSIPEPNSGCQLWMGSADEKGYGLIRIGARLHKAHRLAWTVENGDIPVGLHVLHRCDVRACCNPQHLFLGTHQENMADRDAKGRQPVGSDRWNSKLSAEDVAAIKTDSRSERRIAAMYGVSRSAISAIKQGRSWRHVTGAPQ